MWPDVQLRIRIFLETVSRDQGGKFVLMVVHGHWLILLEMVLLQLFSIEEAERRYREAVVLNGAVTVYESAEDRTRLRFKDCVVPWGAALTKRPFGRFSIDKMAIFWLSVTI